MTFTTNDVRIQFDKNKLEEKKFSFYGGKWFLVEAEHSYILICNNILAQAVPEEIGDDRIIQKGTMNLQDDGSWIVPQDILEYFKTVEMVIEEDSKGFFMTSPSEEARYEKEIRNLADRILFLLESD